MSVTPIDIVLAGGLIGVLVGLLIGRNLPRSADRSPEGSPESPAVIAEPPAIAESAEWTGGWLADVVAHEAGHAILIADSAGRIDWLSDASAALLGRSALELRGRTVAEIMVELGGEDDTAADVRRLFESDDAARGVVRLSPPSSLVRHLRLDVRPAGGDERRGAMVVIIDDVTAEMLERAERVARLEELQAIVDNVPSLIYYKDDRNTIMFANRAGAEAIGRTPDDVAGRCCEELFPEHASKYLADDLEVLAADTPKLNIIEELVGSDRRHWLSTDKIPIDDPRTGDRRILVVVTMIDEQMAMQAELEDQREQLQAIIDAVPAAIMLKDAEGRLVRGNAALSTALNRPIKDMEGQLVNDLWPEHDRPGALAEAALRTHETPRLGLIERHRSESGDHILHSDVVAIERADGVRQTLVVTSDVTELEEARRQLDFAVDAGQLGLWDWSVPSGELWLNEQWFEMLGRRAEHGPHSLETLTDRIHADDRPAVDAAIAAVLAGPEDRLEVEYRVRSSDGCWLWVVNRGMVVSRDARGRAERLVGLHIDIDRQKSDQVRLDVAMDSGQLGLWEWRCDDPEMESTPALLDLLGLSRSSSFDAEAVMDHVHPDDLDRTMQTIALVLIGPERGFEIEHRIRAGTGRWVWMRTVGRVLSRHPDGRPDRLVGFLVDIDLLKRSEARLARALDAAEAGDRAKHAFLTSMSHELRTPITGMLGHAELLEEDDVSGADRVSHAGAIRRHGDQLIELIDALMDVSRVAAEEFAVETATVDLREVFRDVAELFRDEALDGRRELVLECPEPVPARLQTDETRLRQMVVQLISNAMRHAERGRITVRITEQPMADGPSRLAIMVQDCGAGIPAEIVDRLVDPFERVDSSMARRVGGAGVGLTLVHGLSHRLGGDLRICSAEGTGTTVVARIVLNPSDDAERADVFEPARRRLRELEHRASVATIASPERPMGEPPRTGVSRVDGDLRGRRILVAEDGLDNQRLILFHLRRAGATVEIAANGRLAVEAAERARTDGAPFDVVVMDIQMPEMCGIEATEQLRKRGFTVPVIAFTAHATPGERERCLAAGCDEFETKPFIRDRLLSRLGVMLQPPPGEAAA